MTLTDADVQKAEKRMQARMQAQPRAVSARYDRHASRIVVTSKQWSRPGCAGSFGARARRCEGLRLGGHRDHSHGSWPSLAEA